MTPRWLPFKLDLGSALALAFFLLSLLLTLLLTLVIDTTVGRQVKSEIGANLAELAIQTTNHLDRSMFERYREVQLISQRPDLDGGTERLLQTRRTLDALQQTYPYYAWIGLTDTQGRVKAATQGLLQGVDVSARPWFVNANRGVYVGDVHEAKLLASLLPNPDGAPKRFVDVAFPYRDARGAVAGVLGAHIAWQWATDIVQSIVAPVARERQVKVVIVGANGQVLLGPKPFEGTTAPLPTALPEGVRSDFGVSRWPDGRDYLVGHSASRGHMGYPGLGWRILVLQDLDEAYAPVKALRRQVLLGGAAVALLFCVLALVAARAITRPLLVLADKARRIESGEPLTIDPDAAAYAELAALRRSLSSLLASLQQKENDLKQLNATLEKRVGQRTMDLLKAMATVRENEYRVRAIVESAQGAFVAMNFQGQISGWNTQSEKLLGWQRGEVMGRSLFDTLIPARFAKDWQDALQNFLATEQAGFINQRMERLVLTARGEEVPVEMSIALVNTDKLKFFSAFLYDISQRKAVERMKSEFISTVSHELRTPLTGIYGSLSLLVSGMAGELPADVKPLVELSHRSTERLIRLINDVLDVEKIESKSMTYHFQVQPLQPLVAQAVAATQAFADQYGVRLALATEPQAAGLQVRADADRMVQVVVNLLSNAAKFSPAGGATVQVGIEARGEWVRLSVRDQGAGIPDSFRHQVFERFAQADASDRRQKGGTGLGLSICKSIVEAHGGQIGFVSAPGQGTTFHVDLPVASTGTGAEAG